MDERIRFTCPSCGKSVKANLAQAGKRIRCPYRECGEALVVPIPAEQTTARSRRLPVGVLLGLAGLVGVLVLAGAAWWWFQVPSAAEEALCRDYLRSGHELVEMQRGKDRAALVAAREKLRAKAQENLDAWMKVEALPARRRKLVVRKYQSEFADLEQSLALVKVRALETGGALPVVFWGRQIKPEVGPYQVIELGFESTAPTPSTPPPADGPDIGKRLKLRPGPLSVVSAEKVAAAGGNESITFFSGGKLGPLTFPKACTVTVQKNKDWTVLAEQEGVVAKDESGKAWVSRKARLDGKDVFAFFESKPGK